MAQNDLYLGIDLGTSGARAVVIDDDSTCLAVGTARYNSIEAPRDPALWWQAVQTALDQALAQVDARRVRALAVDGTSGTMLATDDTGKPLAEAQMYNDPCTDPAILHTIATHAPATSAAHGATSGLARLIGLMQHRPARVLHQADWISGQFSGRWISDENNALKTGYDPVAAQWPEWIARAGADMALLPDVQPAGEVIAPCLPGMAHRFGLPLEAVVVSGTTDGCASFLATGANRPGDGVTALGSTLTLKLLSDRPVFAPEFGIYSHRILGQWLAGGASNSGGAVLLHYFTPERLAALTALIDPETDSGCDFYPLLRPGERFPIADPALPPRMSPRPDDDLPFLHGLFDGIAAIEALGYQRLRELGAPALTRLRSVGGGAANPVWTRLRERRLGVTMAPALSTDAAFGTALLARHGAP
jgi:sugar (pentulose or hexulose) kinase